MVDKPGRRKKQRVLPWKKVASVAVVVLIIAGVSWIVYWNLIYKAPPIYAQFNTTDGSFEVELYPACAPQTVSNFVSLANSGFYNGLVWHRIIKGFVIQTGDNGTRGGLNSTRATWGTGGTAATIPLELCGWLHNYEGYVAVAHTSSSTNGGSQFYINLSNSTANLNLDGSYTVFGKVISGWSVVQALANSPVCTTSTCNPSWPADEPYPAVFVNSIVIQGTSPVNSTSTTA
ncbi:MAG: peptidylprolyl isomerase [Nitrososphaerota archaeon]|nr:peptidylprolyl isomerase [Nitrososphaerota archaeon]